MVVMPETVPRMVKFLNPIRTKVSSPWRPRVRQKSTLHSMLSSSMTRVFCIIDPMLDILSHLEATCNRFVHAARGVCGVRVHQASTVGAPKDEGTTLVSDC
jgi:hypothetical protein